MARGADAVADSLVLRPTVGHEGEGGGEMGVEGRSRRREVGDEHPMRGGGRCGLGRGVGRGVLDPPVQLVLARDARDGVVHREVDEGEVVEGRRTRPVGRDRADGDLVPGGDDRRVGGRSRWRRRHGRGCDQGQAQQKRRGEAPGRMVGVRRLRGVVHASPPGEVVGGPWLATEPTGMGARAGPAFNCGPRGERQPTAEILSIRHST